MRVKTPERRRTRRFVARVVQSPSRQSQLGEVVSRVRRAASALVSWIPESKSDYRPTFTVRVDVVVDFHSCANSCREHVQQRACTEAGVTRSLRRRERVAWVEA